MKIKEFETMFKCTDYASYNPADYQQLKQTLYPDTTKDIKPSEFADAVLHSPADCREKVTNTFCLYLQSAIKRKIAANPVLTETETEIVETFATSLKRLAQSGEKVLQNNKMKQVICMHLATLKAVLKKSS